MTTSKRMRDEAKKQKEIILNGDMNNFEKLYALEELENRLIQVMMGAIDFALQEALMDVRDAIKEIKGKTYVK